MPWPDSLKRAPSTNVRQGTLEPFPRACRVPRARTMVRGDVNDVGDIQELAETFVVAKYERLVLLNRPARGRSPGIGSF